MSLQTFHTAQDNLAIIYNRIARIAITLHMLSIRNNDFDISCESIDLNFAEAQKMLRQMELAIKGIKDIKENDGQARDMIRQLKERRKTFFDYKLRVFQIKEEYINTKKLRQKEIENQKANEELKLLIRSKGISALEIENSRMLKKFIELKGRLQFKKGILNLYELTKRMLSGRLNFRQAIAIIFFYLSVVFIVFMIILKILRRFRRH